MISFTRSNICFFWKWVNKQRKAYSNGKLTEVRETALNKLGFVWDGKEEKLIQHAEQWNKNFEALKKFVERSNGKFPPKGPELGNFVSNNRTHLKQWHKTGKYYSKEQAHLAEERYEKFKSIGAINW